MPLPDIPQNEYDEYQADGFSRRATDRIDSSLSGSQRFLESSSQRIASLSQSSPIYPQLPGMPLPQVPQQPQLPQVQLPPLPQVGVPGPGQVSPAPAPAPAPAPPSITQPIYPGMPGITPQAPAPPRPQVQPAPPEPVLPQMPQVPGPAPAPRRSVYAPEPSAAAQPASSPFSGEAAGPFASGVDRTSPAMAAATAVAPGQYQTYAREAATRSGIDPDIFLAQIQQESGFNPNAGSPAGALGIAQIVPRYHPGVDPTDPYASLDYAAKLDRRLLDQYGGDWTKALVAYNGGGGAVAAWESGEPYGESRTYVARILGRGSPQQATMEPRSQPPTTVGPTAGAAHAPSPPLQTPGTQIANAPNAEGQIFPLSVRPDNAPTATYHGQGGSDLMAPRGTPVLNMRAGRVDEVFTDNGSHTVGGNAVLIHGDDGLDYYYAHFDQPTALKPGQRVEVGQQIGAVGNSGNAWKGGEGATHLHIGIGYGISSGVGAEGGLGQKFNAQGLLSSLEDGVGKATTESPTAPAPQADQLASLDDTRRQISDSFRARRTAPPPQPVQTVQPVSPFMQQNEPAYRQPDVEQAYAPPTRAQPTAAQPTQTAAATNPFENLGSLIGNAIQGALQSALGGLGGGPPGGDRGNRRVETPPEDQGFDATLPDLNLQPTVGERTQQEIERFRHLGGRTDLPELPLSQFGVPDLTPPRSVQEAIERGSEEALRRGLPAPGPGGQLGILNPQLANPFENPDDLFGPLGLRRARGGEDLAAAFERERGLARPGIVGGGGEFRPGVPRVNQDRADYLAERGMQNPPRTYVENDEPLQRQIADYYERTPSTPDDPAVRSAYDAFNHESHDQYQHLVDRGMTFEPYGDDVPNPYRSSDEMRRDIADNNHLWVYTGGDPHPMMTPQQNWEFRAVHDYFGHANSGVAFGPRGEENAWLEHLGMFSPEAQKAMTTETRGQNSWVNFGPHGEANRADPTRTVFAEQKALLLPDELRRTARPAAGEPYFAPHGMAVPRPGYEAGTPEYTVEQLLRQVAQEQGTNRPNLTREQIRRLPGMAGASIENLDEVRNAIGRGLAGARWYSDVVQQIARDTGQSINPREAAVLMGRFGGNAGVQANYHSMLSVFDAMRQVLPDLSGFEDLTPKQIMDTQAFRDVVARVRKDGAYVKDEDLASMMRGYRTGEVTIPTNAKLSSYTQNFLHALSDLYDPYSTQDVWQGRLFGARNVDVRGRPSGKAYQAMVDSLDAARDARLEAQQALADAAGGTRKEQTAARKAFEKADKQWQDANRAADQLGVTTRTRPDVAANDPAYRTMHALTNWIARELDVSPREAQAAGWAVTRTLFESPDYGEALKSGRMSLNQAMLLERRRGGNLLGEALANSTGEIVSGGDPTWLGKINELRSRIADNGSFDAPPHPSWTASSDMALRYPGGGAGARVADIARPVGRPEAAALRGLAAEDQPVLRVPGEVETDESGKIPWLQPEHNVQRVGDHTYVSVMGVGDDAAHAIGTRLGATHFSHASPEVPTLGGFHIDETDPQAQQALVDRLQANGLPAIQSPSGVRVPQLDADVADSVGRIRQSLSEANSQASLGPYHGVTHAVEPTGRPGVGEVVGEPGSGVGAGRPSGVSTRDRLRSSFEQRDLAARLFRDATPGDVTDAARAGLSDPTVSGPLERLRGAGQEAYGIPSFAVHTAGTTAGALLGAASTDENDPNRGAKIAASAAAGFLGGQAAVRIATRGAASAGRGLSRSAPEKAWDAFVRRYSDRLVDLNHVQEDFQRITGKAMTDDQKVAYLARVDPTNRALVATENAVGQSMRRVDRAGNYDALQKWVSVEADIATAEGLGQRVEAEFLKGGVAPVVQRRITEAQQRLREAQREAAELRNAMNTKRTINRFGGVPTQQMVNAADRRVTVAQRWVARRQADLRQAQHDLPAAARAQGWAQREGRIFEGSRKYQDLLRERADMVRDFSARPGEWADIQRAANDLFDYRRVLLEEMVDSKLITRAQASELVRTYPKWAPSRVLEYMADDSGRGMKMGDALSVSSPNFQTYTLEGYAGPREDRIASLFREAYDVYARGAKNRAFNAFVEYVDAAKPTGIKRIANDWGEYRAAGGASGDLHPPDYHLKPGLDEMPISGYRNGTKQKWVTDNPYLQQAIENAPDSPMSGIVGKLWQGGARLTVETATARNPKWLAKNIMRDAGTYLIGTMAEGGVRGNVLPLAASYGPAMATYLSTDPNDPDRLKKALAAGAAGYMLRSAPGVNRAFGPNLLGEMLYGYTDALRGITSGRFLGPATQEYLLRGGGMRGGTYARGTVEGAEKLVREVRDPGGIRIRNASDLSGLLKDAALMGWVKAIGQRLELGPRVAAMRVAEARGASRLESMVAGRDVTLDFDRGGLWTKQVNRVIPFLNAQAQGGARFTRLMRDQPGGLVLAGMALVGGPALAAMQWNRADPQRSRDYDNVPDYIKNRGLTLMIPWVGVDKDGNRQPLHLDIDLSQFAPFGIAAQEVYDRAQGQQGRSAGDLAKAGLGVLVPGGSSNPVEAATQILPPPASTIAQLGLNRDIYRGSTIANQFSDERASEPAKALAPQIESLVTRIPGLETARIRPSHVDFFIRDIAGGAGQTVTDVANQVMGREPRVPGAPSEAPVVGGLASGFLRTTSGQDFEDVRQPTQMLAQDLRERLRSLGGETQYYEPSVVPDEIKKVPLRQAEQTDYQRLTNQYFDQYLRQAMQQPRFDQSDVARKAFIDRAMTAAREKAAAEVFAQIRQSGSNPTERYRQKSSAY